MKLIGAITSPYVRKVRVVLAEKKLDYQYEVEDPWSGDALLKSNPLGKVPVLVLGAGRDMFFPPLLVQSTGRLWGVAPELFPDLGHAMMLDEGWEAVAGRLGGWVQETVF